MKKYLDLSLKCMAIGSLPHNNSKIALKMVENIFDIPFWPQLAKLNRKEDMIFQFLEHMPGIVFGEEKVYLDNESDSFFEQLEELFMDYEEVISDINSEALDKYAVTDEFSSTFSPFLEVVKNKSYKYAKGQICGPFTLATSLTDKDGKCAFYDETLREVIIKTLTLKALWQIREIKKVNNEVTPIIFMDEPSISQLGTSAFITISKEEVITIFKEISDLIQQNGGICGIHCCGKCDWDIPIQCGVNILNLDGYLFAQNLSLFADSLKPFLKNGGIIAWGMIPTLDSEALEKADIGILMSKFDEAIDYLVKKGIDKKMLLEQSMITPSCGAGSLSLELAEKAMNLTKNLSVELKERFNS